MAIFDLHSAVLADDRAQAFADLALQATHIAACATQDKWAVAASHWASPHVSYP
ncbi:MAG: hypothetical protein KatS3mg131_2085 [Candidatus Tectimicrobiota bacterium]|nr:MAG: hypothetical protein KatS3mg131_2085 [Candidatus Tectomicrobia bacterium]